jgi:aminoglycoside phosphotransferase (APT) family kinase protein
VADGRDRIAGGLRAWLAARGLDARVEVTGRATVGLSQETWFVRIAADGEPADAVVRLPTPASGARAIVAQRAALQAVAGRVPAPAVLWHDDHDDHPLGRPFIVMERVAGDVPVGWHEVAQPARAALAAQAIDVLAALHALEVRAPELAAPSVAADLAWHDRRLRRLGALPPVLETALWWLARHAPGPPLRRAFLHGDFRMGNFLVEGGRIAGVLDWEMAGHGDPLADLAWCFIPVWEPADVDERALAARYAARSGVDVDEERLRWHRVLGFVRLAYYALSATRAFDAGRSDDLRLAALRVQLRVHLDRLAATLTGEPVT